VRLESRRLIYVGINYVIAPPPLLDKVALVGFQGALISNGGEFSTATQSEGAVEVKNVGAHPILIVV